METAEEERLDRIVREAFGQRMALIAYARAMLRDHAAADDAVQETFRKPGL
jgi:DNA-directed RNA polymerase specialized sigma24 family protein